MEAGGEVTSVLAGLSRRPVNTRFCARPFGITSISRTTMSARFTPLAMRAESVNLNFPMRLTSSVKFKLMLSARIAAGERQFEFPDALRLQRELQAADAAGFHRQGLGGNVIHQGKPVVGLQLQA